MFLNLKTRTIRKRFRVENLQLSECYDGKTGL